MVTGSVSRQTAAPTQLPLVSTRTLTIHPVATMTVLRVRARSHAPIPLEEEQRAPLEGAVSPAARRAEVPRAPPHCGWLLMLSVRCDEGAFCCFWG